MCANIDQPACTNVKITRRIVRADRRSPGETHAVAEKHVYLGDVVQALKLQCRLYSGGVSDACKVLKYGPTVRALSTTTRIVCVRSLGVTESLVTCDLELMANHSSPGVCV